MTETVGRFQVLERLGQGGMCEVFIGRPTEPQPEDPELVVLKRVLPEFAKESMHERMLLDEASILARLQHRNIVRLIDMCRAKNSTFVVLEYLAGHDLAAISKELGIRGTRIPLTFTLSVLADAAAGLAHAHGMRAADGRALGIVHRDVSPHNIMVCYDGAVKLLDFGVAKANERITRTQTGMLKGKIAYMAPEQANGDEVTSRSDIFALGIVLYELTVGKRPFRARGEIALLRQVLACDVEWPTEIYDSFSKPLEDLMRSMLAKNPAQRPSGSEAAAQMRALIEDFSDEERVDSAPAAVLHRYFPERWKEVNELRAGRAPASSDPLLSSTRSPSQLVVTAEGAPVLDDAVATATNDRAATSARTLASATEEVLPSVEEVPLEVPQMPVPDVVMSFENSVTHIDVSSPPPPQRWARIVDGLEGRVRFRFEVGIEDDAGSFAAFVSAVAALRPEVTTLDLEAVPVSLAPALASTRARLVSLQRPASECLSCGAAVPAFSYNPDGADWEDRARCPACKAMVARPTVTTSAPQRQRRLWVVAAAAGGLVLVAVTLALVAGG